MNAMSLKRPYRKKVFVADSDMLLSEPFYISVFTSRSGSGSVRLRTRD